MLCKAIKKFHISKCKNLFWVTSATAFFKFPNQHRASYPRHPPRTSWTVTSGQPRTQESSHNLSASKYSFRIPQSHGLSHLRTFLKVLMEQAGHAISLAESFCQLFQFINQIWCLLPETCNFAHFFTAFSIPSSRYKLDTEKQTSISLNFILFLFILGWITNATLAKKHRFLAS